MAVTILSPHLDDAVLSCWTALEAPEQTTVLNVLDGAPPAGAPLAWWDARTGARDSRARMDERHEEDRRALAAVGVPSAGLGLLDGQYRSAPLPLEELVDALEAALAADAEVLAPAALSGHPDHCLVRDAALTLGRPVRLYADLPHGISGGWPGWVRGRPAADAVSRAWDAALAAAGLAVSSLVATVHVLDAATRRRKLAALAHYRTQRAALDTLAFVGLDDPRALAHEVCWQVPGSAQAGVIDAVGQRVHERR